MNNNGGLYYFFVYLTSVIVISMFIICIIKIGDNICATPTEVYVYYTVQKIKVDDIQIKSKLLVYVFRLLAVYEVTRSQSDG